MVDLRSSFIVFFMFFLSSEGFGTSIEGKVAAQISAMKFWSSFRKMSRIKDLPGRSKKNSAKNRREGAQMANELFDHFEGSRSS